MSWQRLVLARARVRRATASLPLLLAAGLAGPGCVVATDTGPVLADGLLTVDWSIAGSLDPGLCVAYAVDAMEVVIYDRFGDFVTEVEAPCEAFTLTVALYPDLYHADATLVGFYDESASVTEPLDGLDIIEDTELIVEVDYPLGTLY